MREGQSDRWIIDDRESFPEEDRVEGHLHLFALEGRGAGSRDLGVIPLACFEHDLAFFGEGQAHGRVLRGRAGNA